MRPDLMAHYLGVLDERAIEPGTGRKLLITGEELIGVALHKFPPGEFSQEETAKALGVPQPTYNRFLLNLRPPAPAILKALGYERVVLYRRKRT